MQGISITSQRAQIEISTQRAQLNIQRHRPRMYVHTRKARMMVERRNPQFTVVREQPRVDSAPVPTLGHAKDLYIDNGQSASPTRRLNAIRANNDSVLAGLDALADLSSERASQRIRADSPAKASAAPTNLSQIQWDMGHYSVDWEPYEMVIEWDMTGEGPKISFSPHSVEIKLSRYPSVKMTFSAEYFERTEKKKIDKKI